MIAATCFGFEQRSLPGIAGPLTDGLAAASIPAVPAKFRFLVFPKQAPCCEAKNSLSEAGGPASRVCALAALLSPGGGLDRCFASDFGRSAKADDGKKLRVVIFAAHPVDLAPACGGLVALLTKAGHEVIPAYATSFRGARKIGDEPEAVVLHREADAAAKILGVKPHYFKMDMDKLQGDEATVKTIGAWLDETKPDIVLTHWPLDTHLNHHMASSIIWQCYFEKKPWNLYFFEIMTEQQSLGFRPEVYVDIGAVDDIKRKAVGCHEYSRPDHIWKVHDPLQWKRGAECGVIEAEAYIQADPANTKAKLPVLFLRRKN